MSLMLLSVEAIVVNTPTIFSKPLMLHSNSLLQSETAYGFAARRTKLSYVLKNEKAIPPSRMKT
jgi:hypothetical protein